MFSTVLCSVRRGYLLYKYIYIHACTYTMLVCISPKSYCRYTDDDDAMESIVSSEIFLRVRVYVNYITDILLLCTRAYYCNVILPVYVNVHGLGLKVECKHDSRTKCKIKEPCTQKSRGLSLILLFF